MMECDVRVSKSEVKKSNNTLRGITMIESKQNETAFHQLNTIYRPLRKNECECPCVGVNIITLRSLCLYSLIVQ